MASGTVNALLPPHIASAQRKLREYVRKQLDALLKNPDEALAALADQQGAKDAARRSTFDITSWLRDHHTRLIDNFVQSYDANFTRAVGFAPSMVSSQVAMDTKKSSLQLVDEQEMEESLAVTGMVERVNNTCGDGLYALAQRFNQVLAGAQFDEQTLPVGPRVVCEAFRGALLSLGTDATTEMKQVAFKLFDKHIARSLGDVYNEINADMAAAGILPEIKIVIRRQPDNAAPRKQPSASAEQPATAAVVRTTSSGETVVPQRGVMVDAGLFEKLNQLFGSHLGGGTFATSSLVGHGETTTPPEQATRELVNTLSTLQRSAASDITGGTLGSQDLAAALVKAITELQTNQNQAPTPVTQMDANTIDIVALLFEFVLDDNNIPGSLRALISKLQLPYLKVALLDKDFFNNYAHPARRLLNELGHAGIGWRHGEDPLDDPLYKKVSAIVEKIVSGFDADVSLFQQLLDDFAEFVAVENSTGEMQELIIGRTKNDVKEIIEQKIAKQTIPALVHDFLVGPWREVLEAAHKKGGSKGDAWERTVQVADELIWSIQPKANAESRTRLVKMLPTLLRSLRTGLQSIDYDAAKIDQHLHSLQPLHMALLHGKLPEELAAGKSNKGTLGTVLAESSQQKGDTDPMEQARKKAADTVQSLATGEWLEFVKGDKSSVRGKLIWHSAVFDDYTFVNRMYKVVAERNSAQLIDEFVNGGARRLEQVPLIDRALDAVMAKLKGG